MYQSRLETAVSGLKHAYFCYSSLNGDYTLVPRCFVNLARSASWLPGRSCGLLNLADNEYIKSLSGIDCKTAYIDYVSLSLSLNIDSYYYLGTIIYMDGPFRLSLY